MSVDPGPVAVSVKVPTPGRPRAGARRCESPGGGFPTSSPAVHRCYTGGCRNDDSRLSRASRSSQVRISVIYMWSALLVSWLLETTTVPGQLALFGSLVRSYYQQMRSLVSECAVSIYLSIYLSMAQGYTRFFKTIRGVTRACQNRCQVLRYQVMVEIKRGKRCWGGGGGEGGKRKGVLGRGGSRGGQKKQKRGDKKNDRAWRGGPDPLQPRLPH